MKASFCALVTAVAVLFAAFPGTAQAAGFSLSASNLLDNGMLPKSGAYTGNAPDGSACGGDNRAPGFSWKNAPASTQSFAILEVDPDGGHGLGVDHWVLYNIPGWTQTISPDEIAAQKYTAGKGTGGLVGYRGPCPPAGDAPHHYVVTIFALDAPPNFPDGLDHDGVLAAIKPHIIAATTTIMRFAR